MTTAVTNTEPDTRPITDRLKQDTQDLHDAAEDGGFNKALIEGDLSKDAYAAMLGQLRLVHAALEAAIRKHVDTDPALKAVMTEEQYQVRYTDHDLKFLGVHIDTIEPVPATAALIDEINRREAEEPHTLVGLHYVVEGSNNGGRFIAKRVREAYGFDGDDGVKYLDPYGKAQPGMWKEWKQALLTVDFTDEQTAGIVEAARVMFQAIGQIHAQLAVQFGIPKDA